jgi:LysM repeat protein
MEFHRYKDTAPAFYYATPDKERHGFTGFLLYDHTGPLPDTISFADAFDVDINRGYYVFLPELPQNPGAWAACLAKLLGPEIPEHTGIAWCKAIDPETAVQKDLSVIHFDENAVQVNECVTQWGSYRLFLPERSSVVIDTSLTGAALLWSPPGTIPGKSIRIAFEGKRSGMLSTEASIGDFTPGKENGWDIGMYYFIPGKHKIISQYYPVFRPETGTQTLFHLYWDPCSFKRTEFLFARFSYQMIPDETAPGNYRLYLPPDPSRLSTWLRTDMGRAVYLHPVKDFRDEEARLVFQLLPDGDFYLAPAGDFEMLLENEPGKQEVHYLLCGLSGTETIGFTPRNAQTRGDVLCFTPDQPAFVISFPQAGSFKAEEKLPADEKCGSAYLSNRFTSSWVTMRRYLPVANEAHGNYYYAQPESSPLFGGETAGKENSQRFFQSGFSGQTEISNLPFYRPPSAILKPPSKQICNSFPLTPLSGAVAEKETIHFHPGNDKKFNFISFFEQQVIAPSRAGILLDQPEHFEKIKSGKEDTPATYSTTPQGLLVEIPAGELQWRKIWLASESPDNELSFTSPGNKLQAAFQAEKQFLVMSMLPDGQAGSFDSEISIEKWPFILNVPATTKTGNYRNVILFKFMPGKIADLVGTPEVWTRATDFNSDPQDISQWLKTFTGAHSGLTHHEIYHSAEGDSPESIAAKHGVASERLKKINPHLGSFPLPGTPVMLPALCNSSTESQNLYTAFNDIIHSETWTGILALNVDIGLDNFPDELKGLLGGINLENFSAHHFGVEVSQVKYDAAASRLKYSDPSSLFGLVDYKDYSANTNRPYDFKVNLLQVLFKNSSIADFRCCISLTIGSLFDENVTIRPEPPSPLTINLKGTYENHEGVASYSFVGNDEYKIASAKGRVWNNAELSQVQFYTLSQKEETVYAVFSFWGRLAFNDLTASETGVKEKFDPLSFDALPFSGMQLLMNFNIPDPPSSQPQLNFLFDPSNISFINAPPRKLSLARNLAMSVRGISSGDASSLPNGKNYFRIDTPLKAPAEIKGRWYGLRYDFDLGTAGGLAAQAGFTANLLVCWTPQDLPGGTQIALFLHLPGSGMLATTIQSVLTLSISSAQFVTDYDHAGEKINYQLILDNISLKTFGISLPPGGKTNAFLFSNPDPDGQRNSTGWYLAYKKK